MRVNISNQTTFKMIVLPAKPSVGTIFSKDNSIPSKKMEPFVVGEGVLDYQCGHCGHTLLRSIRYGQVTQAVYKCPKCGVYNQIEIVEKRH